MAKQPTTKPEHDDGTWFLQAVGAEPPEPTPSEVVAELERENTMPDLPALTQEASETPRVGNTEIEIVSFDGDPGTSTSSFAPMPVPPPSPPQLSDATAEIDIVAAPTADLFDDTLLAPALRTRRRFRWPVAGFFVLVLAVVAIAALWLPRAAENEAFTVRQSNYDATLAVRTYLPTAQTALDAITNPASTSGVLSASVPVISQLSSHATNLATVAEDPLPRRLPLVPSQAITDLEPIQEQSAILASDASEVARRLGHGYVYRTSIPGLLATGQLPTSATTQEVNAIAIRLASSLADDAALISDLPTDDAFAAVLAQATQAQERYGPWQVAYLGALTSRNPDAAAALIAEIDEITSALKAQNLATLLEFRSSLDERIVSLAVELQAHLDHLTQ